MYYLLGYKFKSHRSITVRFQTVGWRKWRWSFNSRLSRRTSHATEETMLRLEERLSMSSSDYTGHIIPCIEGGAVQIHEQIGKVRPFLLISLFKKLREPLVLFIVEVGRKQVLVLLL